MPSLSEILANHSGKGYVIAPAGFGKTHLIADAVKISEGRQLILTHTHAGVDALKKKLQKLDVLSAKYHVDTIASYALKLCLSYPQTANWNIEVPSSGEEWEELCLKCTALVGNEFIKRVLCASYEGIYVDEYQDCMQSHHNMLLAFSETLPLRILGDPLQAIFDGIGGQNAVDWDTQLVPHFEHLGELDTPHRWIHDGDPALGQWLRGLRGDIEVGNDIDIQNGLPPSVTLRVVSNDAELQKQQINVCKWGTQNKDGRIIAIHKGDGQYKNKCHALAKLTSGFFSSIEEIEGSRLFAFVRAYDRKATAQDKLLCIIELMKEKCFSGISDALSAATKRGEHANIQAKTKNPEIVQAANEFLNTPSSSNLSVFIQGVKNAPETTLYARDLFYRLLKVLTINKAEPALTLGEAATLFQKQFRHTGRPISYPKLIGTTLLVKGQEYDHAIVLDASSLSKKDLYVALTRGSKSLTIISKNRILRPT
ncbi:MAG: hypothetical protein ACI9D5_002084 [Candidatus Endobugula sp.]|jgi:hypothetical protein